MATGGVLWLGGFFGLALVVPGQAALWLLVVASMGSAAFHPAGVMQATLRGQTHFSGRETTSAAFFFVFGQTGFFIGPVLGGPLLDRFGPLGLLLLVSLALPTGLNVGYRLRRAPLAAPAVGAAASCHRPDGDWSTNRRRAGAPPAAAAGFCTGGGFPGLGAAKHDDFRAQIYPRPGTKPIRLWGDDGFVHGRLGAGERIRRWAGGPLRQKASGDDGFIFGQRAAVFSGVGRLVGVAAAFIPLGGALTGAVHSIIVVLAQRMLPSGMALASGLILGFMFSAGALGTFVERLSGRPVGAGDDLSYERADRPGGGRAGFQPGKKLSFNGRR